MPGHPGTTAQLDPADGFALVRFVGALHRAATLDELGRTFAAGFGRLTAFPMFGFNVVHPGSTRLRHNVWVNVSDIFVTRYVREVMDDDPLRVHAHATGRVAYNLDLLSPLEWEESEAYRRAFATHRMRHVVEAPMTDGGVPIGSLHFATDAVEHDLGPADVRLAELVADVLAQAVAQISTRERLSREREEARAALELAGVAVVLSDPGATELRLNAAARRLLADVADADERLHRLLGRRALDGLSSRRVEVDLPAGETGTLHADCRPLGGDAGPIVTVLALRRDHARVSPSELAALTPREAEVAGLVVDGLADREIAQQLSLSHHTVSQYVKRVYRKLDVGSRVGLARLLLGAPSAVRTPTGSA